MPELPEVETIVREIKPKVLKRTFVGFWTDAPKLVKRPKSLNAFKKSLIGLTVKNVERRAKNILFRLSDGKTLLLHPKMTGHLLLGKWQKKGSGWESLTPGPITDDPVNRFIHVIFFLDGSKMMALSDMRKFAKIELWEDNDLQQSEEFIRLGPEPLEASFTLKKFFEILKRKHGKIKQVLMDPGIIAGIGNIYSDEILWTAQVHPLRLASSLSSVEVKRIYTAIKKILTLALRLGGTSISDYRKPSGEKGLYSDIRKVYRRNGKKCPRCGQIIKRIRVGGRSAHYCAKCQQI